MRGALVVLLLLAQPVSAQTACDPAKAAELRAHLELESQHAKKWNLVWGAIFATAAIGSGVIGYINPAPELQTGFYVSAGKASIGALGRFILPLRIGVPEPNSDVCADLAALHKAIALAAQREKGNFYLNHIAGILINGAGALIIWKYGEGSQAILSVATGYPVGLLSNYTAPRATWHLYRERDWSIGIAPQPQQGAWLITLGGEL